MPPTSLNKKAYKNTCRCQTNEPMWALYQNYYITSGIVYRCHFSNARWSNKNYEMNVSRIRKWFWKKIQTIMALNPRAPVLRSIANLAIPLSASGVNVKSTLSIPKRIWYWWTIAFFGSVSILINRSWFSEWNGTKTGNRPTNSCGIR